MINMNAKILLAILFISEKIELQVQHNHLFWSLNEKKVSSLGDYKRNLEHHFTQEDKRFWDDGIIKFPER